MPIITSIPPAPLPVSGLANGSRAELTRAQDALARGGKDPRIAGFLPRLARGLADEGDGEGGRTAGAETAAEQGRPANPLPVPAAEGEAGGDSAPFLAQALAQEDNGQTETPIDPFGQATQAYGRLAGNGPSLVLDLPARVDFTV
jgi:hypothetical protein